MLRIQRNYVEAGSDVIITNTFGASRIMLDRHGQGDRTVAINREGAAIAREALGGSGYVLGDIGPFGGLMEPYGDIAPAVVEKAFREQAWALVDGGVDGIIIETQTAFEELEIAIRAAREAGAQVVIASIAFDRMADEDDVRTMAGIGPGQAAEFMAANGCDIAALNCGTGVDVTMAAKIVQRYRGSCDLPQLLAAGPRIVGGCCGSTPAHIRLFRQLIDKYNHPSRV